jgi:Ser/Thr protein kinase RdoA (MazF antagonist)
MTQAPIDETAPSGAAAGLLDTRLSEVARRFVGRQPDRIERLGRGLINDTFRVRSDHGCFVLQRINTDVFPAPERIMDNLLQLQGALEQRSDTPVRLPHVLLADDGRPWARDEHGNFWRMLELIEGSRTLARLDNAGQGREIGRILGGFHYFSATLDPAAFAVTLPDFHVTPVYLDALRRAETNAEPRRRDADVAAALATIDHHAELAYGIEHARQQGQIAERVVHGDPKLDNILFDLAGERALCLIDLDTIQPGLPHHDIGDCLRSCCNRGGKTGDAGDVCFDLDSCRAILNAYAQHARGVLDEIEIGLLYQAIRLIPFELALRFLADHLRGDRYFRVSAPGENLRKARVQLALLADIERKAEAIERIIADAFSGGD